MNFPDKYLVYDIRSSKDLKNSTISGYKKMDVVNAFQNSMINNNIQESIKWCVELHISCYDKDIWKSFFNVYFKNVHFKNPKLFIYLLKRKKTFNNLIQFYPKNHSLFSRNNIEIRNLYAELTCFINNSPKSNLFLNKSLPSINIKKLNNNELKKRMISKNALEIEQFIFSDTNSTIKLCLNEIYNHLKPDTSNANININNIFFWYLYLEKNKINKNTNNNNNIDLNKKNISVMDFFNSEENKQKNANGNAESNCNENKIHDTHWTFMLWNIINYFKIKFDKNNIILIEKLEFYYKDNFKLTQISSKKYIFLYCFYIIKNKINWNAPLIYQEHIYIQSNANINNMYLNILKNIYSTLNNDQKEIYFKKYYKTIKSYLNKNDKNANANDNDNDDTNLNKIDMNENLNKILLQNHDFLIKNKKKNNNINNNNSTIKSTKENNNLINKNKTLKDVLEQKEEKIIKKLDLFVNCFIQKKKNKPNVFDYYKNTENNNKEEYIKNVHLKKK